MHGHDCVPINLYKNKWGLSFAWGLQFTDIQFRIVELWNPMIGKDPLSPSSA